MKNWKIFMLAGCVLLAIAAIGNFTPQYNAVFFACGFFGFALFAAGALESLRHDAR